MTMLGSPWSPTLDSPPADETLPAERDGAFGVWDVEGGANASISDHMRKALRQAIAQAAGRGARVAVRIDRVAWAAAVDAATWHGLRAIISPKSESPDRVGSIDALLTALERARGIRPGAVEIRPALETARGVVHALAIASSSRRIRSIAATDMNLGLAHDLGVERRATSAMAHYAVGEAELVAHVVGLETRQAASSQQEPGADALGEARRAVEFFEALDVSESVAGDPDGKLVDRWEAVRARMLLQQAKSSAERTPTLVEAFSQEKLAEEALFQSVVAGV